MFKFKFIQTAKPRQFNYTPRSYDPELEKFEHLKDKYDTNTGRRSHINFSKNTEAKRKAQRSSTIRLAVIITLLIFIGWWLLH